MNILQLISSGGLYGAESMLLTLSGALARRGHRVIAGVFENRRDPHIEVAAAAQARGLETHLIPCSGRWDTDAVRSLRTLLHDCAVDVLHTHGYKADLYGFAAARERRSVSLVSTCHNWPDQRLLMRAYAAIDRFALREFAAVATPSTEVRSILTRSGVAAERASVVRNGIDFTRFAGAEPSFRDPANRLIGLVGRLVPAKGGYVLLQAARRVLITHPNVRFVFVGSGPSREEWETVAASLGISDRVLFMGERSDMPGVYSSLDIVTLPSFEEAMPMCLLEALAAARPVVATNVGEIPEIIQHRETGLLVEPGNVEELAQALKSLLDKPGQAAQLAAQGQLLVREQFSSDAMAKSYEDLYRSVIPAPPAASSELDISIIAACRNEAPCIRRFLDSLLSQEFGTLTWEAIIADGMSTDSTPDIIAEYARRNPNIRLQKNPGRIVSTGLNSALRASRGRLILRMDAHTRYAPDYCAHCVEASAATRAANVGGPARTAAETVKGRAIAAAYHSRFSTGGARFHNPSYRGWVDTVPYGCWPREIFDQIGTFDERLVRNQDDEFNLRLIRAGGRIWQDPAIQSWYSPRAELRALFHQYFQYGFWKVAVIRKHRLPGSWRHLVPVVFVMLHVALAAAAFANLPGALRLWMLFLASYAAANATASLAAARNAGWSTLPYLPAVFGTFHLSYGLGFLAGLLRFGWRPVSNLPANSVFARITR